MWVRAGAGGLVGALRFVVVFPKRKALRKGCRGGPREVVDMALGRIAYAYQKMR